MNKITPGYESDRVSDTLGRRAATELFLALEAGSLVDPQTVLKDLKPSLPEKIYWTTCI